jgi:hypothetical protein
MTLTLLKKTVFLFLGALFLASPSTARADITIVLQNGFIEQQKRRVTIDTEFLVDKAHKKPNPASKDGDLHVAGRADEVKLPIVAEIMNAKDDMTAVDDIHEVEGTGTPIKLSGAWRLWCEHAGEEQIQGQPLKPFKTTNPDHVFEVHPVTSLNGRDLLHTLKPIQGFQTKDADNAFTKYESLRCKIIPGNNTTTLVTTMAGFNYVEFIMDINSPPQDSEDGGLMVMCKVRDLNQELLVHNRRMVMVKGSEVEQMTRDKPVGTRIHVLGLPRINLSLVSRRVQAAAQGRQDVLTWGLPYEIIVVGFYEFVEPDDDDEDEPVKKSFKKTKKGEFIPKTFTPKEVEDFRKATAPPSLMELNEFEGKSKSKPKFSGSTEKSPQPREVPSTKKTPKGKLPKSNPPDLIEEK